MGTYVLPISRPVAEASIRNEIRDVVAALRPEDGIPAEIAISVRRRPKFPGDRSVDIDVRVTWEDAP